MVFARFVFFIESVVVWLLLLFWNRMQSSKFTVVQTMNIMIVNQSVIDTFASLFSLIFVMPLKKSGLSHDSAYDQFVCRFWLTRRPLWCMLATSTYGIVIMTLSRYIAVIYPIKYKIVRITAIVQLVCKVKYLNLR